MADVILSTDMKAVVAMLERMEYNEVVKTKDIRKEVRKTLRPAQKELQNTAKGALASDPKKAHKAVKMSTYRDGNGGNISILNKRTAAKKMSLTNASTGGVSGIKRNYVSKVTKRTRGYIGADRAFILRFINSGTQARHTTARRMFGMKKSAYRGFISARNFFGPKAESELKKSERALSDRIVKLIMEVSKAR